MGKILGFISILCLILVSFLAKAFPFDPDSLVKVNSGNHVNCIEYYTYKGELYCSPTAQNSQHVNPNIKEYEKLNIAFDERAWQLAWGKSTGSITTVEYVPGGDSIEHWKELITSQYFPNLQNKASPKEFADLIVQDLKDSGFKPIVQFLQESPEQVIFEFQIKSPKNQIQDEIQMITKDNKGLYVLHYVVKKTDMGAETRAKWSRNLMDTKVKNTISIQNSVR